MKIHCGGRAWLLSAQASQRLQVSRKRQACGPGVSRPWCCDGSQEAAGEGASCVCSLGDCGKSSQTPPPQSSLECLRVSCL